MKYSIYILLFSFFITSLGFTNNISDSWTNIPKFVGGDFEGPGSEWVNYELNDGIDAIGRRYRRFRLVPGTKLNYKYFLQLNSDTIWEPDFSTASTNREIEIVDRGDGKMIVEDNWADTPSHPTNLSFVAGDGEITLTWEPPADNTRWDVIYGGGYNIYYDTGPTFTSWNRVNSNTITDTSPYTITGLNNNDTYFFSVRAYDAYFDTHGPLFSDFAPYIKATPSLPVDVIVRFFSAGLHYDTVSIGFDTGADWTERPLKLEQNGIYWSDTISLPANYVFTYKFIVENDTIGKLYEFDDNTQLYWTFVYPHKPNISSFQIAGRFNEWNRESLTLNKDGFWRGNFQLSPGKYEYKVIINNNWQLDPYNPLTTDKGDDDENSIIAIDRMPTASQMREFTVPFADSYIVSADWSDTPYIPSNFRALSTDATSIRLSWRNRLHDIQKFVIYYTEADPSELENWVLLDEVSGSDNFYLHSNIIPQQNYYYRIYAVDYAGNQSGVNFSETKLTPPVQVKIIVDAATDADSVALAGSFNDWDWSNEMTQLPDGRWADTIEIQLNVSYEYRISMNGDSESNAQYEFTYVDESGLAQIVSVAGDMNGWNPTANIMRQTDTYTWKTWLRNINQNDQYKFVVDGEWTPDPNFRPDITKVPFANGNRRLFVSDTSPVEINFNGYPDPPVIDIANHSPTSLKLTLIPNEVSFNNISYYNVYRSDTSNYGFEKIISISPDSTEYIDTGLTTFKNYYYRVTAVDTGISDTWMLEGSFSNQVRSAPVAPIEVYFAVDMTGLNFDTVYIGSHNLDANDTNWKIYPLSYQGNNLYGDTYDLYPNTNISYKYLFVNGDTVHEFDNYSGRYHLFTYPDDGASNIFVRGSGPLGWSIGEQMTLNEDGIWRAVVYYSTPGLYEYKFVRDGNWINDPNNPYQLNGNSVVGIDLASTPSGMRQRTVSLSNYSFIDNWEDTPVSIADFSALALSDSSVKLNWSGADFNLDADTVSLYYTNDVLLSLDEWKKVSDFSVFDTEYIHTGLNTNTTYFYKIFVYDFAGLKSQNSSLVKAVPMPPQPVSIIVDAKTDAESVALAGSFNNWDWSNEMTQLPDGRWADTVHVMLNIPYEYRVSMNGIIEADAQYEFTYTHSSANMVSVAGDMNDWNPDVNLMRKVSSNTWKLWLRGINENTKFKYVINGNYEEGEDRTPDITKVPFPNGNRRLFVSDTSPVEIDFSGHPSPPVISGNIASETSVRLVITASDRGAEDRYLYNIYRSNDTFIANYIKIDSVYVSEVETEFIDSGLTTDSTYYYRVTTVDTGFSLEHQLEGNFSNEVILIPSLPVSVTFAIDMTGFVSESSSDKNPDTVFVASSDLYENEWTLYELTKDTGSFTYSRDFQLFTGSNISYKFGFQKNNDIFYEYAYSTGRKHLFIYPYNGTDTSVRVRGDGPIGWEAGIEMELYADNFWRAVVDFSNAGTYEYKFYVNDSDWAFDPFNPYVCSEINNSVLGIDARPTESGMREIIVPSIDTAFTANWEDTPFNIAGLTALAWSETSVQITWSDVDLIRDADSVILYYSDTPEDTESWTRLAELDASVNQYLHSNLNEDTTYYYRAYVQDFVGLKSQHSQLTSAQPSQPKEIMIIVDARQDADSVALAGSFNNWDWTNEMIQLPDGRWTDTVAIQLNIPYEYRVSMNGIIEADAQYEFTYIDANDTALVVAVAGDMNGWNPDANLMRKVSSNTWKLWLRGINENTEYKFVVDGEWTPDPNFRPDINKVPFANGNRRLFVSDTSPVEIDFSGHPSPPVISGNIASETSVRLVIIAPDRGAEDRYLYNIYRSSDTFIANYIKIDSVYASEVETEFIDSGLTTDSTYYYRVTTVDTGVSSNWQLEGNFSNEIHVIPSGAVIITFAIDMTGFYTESDTDNNPDTVFVASSDLYENEWTLYELTKDTGSFTYSRDFEFIPGKNISYKFGFQKNNETIYEYAYSTGRKHLFIYPYNGTDTSVKVRGAGPIGWDAGIEMELYADNFWRAVVDFSNAGTYEYKFYVNDSDWALDPYNHYTKNDNSLLGIDAKSTESGMREITVPSIATAFTANWEDTPFNIAGLNALAWSETSVKITWSDVDLIRDADTVILYYTETPQNNESWTRLEELDASKVNYLHTGLNLDTTYYYRAHVQDFVGLKSQHSQLIWSQPSQPQQIIIIVDARADADSVALAGSFNNWDWSNEMTQLPDGRWADTVAIQLNIPYEYRVSMNGIIEADAQYEFTYIDANDTALVVSVAGDMNGWNPDANLMRKVSSNTWKLWLRGINENTEYKFVVDGEWTPDPNFRPDINKVPFANGNRRLFVSDTSPVEIDFSGHPSPPVISGNIASETSVRLVIIAPDRGAEDRYLYNIYRSSDTFIANYIKIDSVYASEVETEFIDSGLTTDSTYYYRVTTVDTGVSLEHQLEGNFSNEIHVIPSGAVIITFAIDMTGFYTESDTDNNPDTVFVASSDLYENEWTLYELTKDTGSFIYSRDFELFTGSNISYKFGFQKNNEIIYEYAYSIGRKHLFIYPYNGTDDSVRVRGADPIGWNYGIDMELGDDNFWRTVVDFSNAGTYEYKFYVNDSDWALDTYNHYTKNDNSLLGIDAKPTESGMREIIVPSIATAFTANWEDTPFNISQLNAIALTDTVVQLSWADVDLIRDADSVILYYSVTPETNASWTRFAELDASDVNYFHTGLTTNTTYYYRAYVQDYAGLKSQHSQLTSAKPAAPIKITFILDAGTVSDKYDSIVIGGSFNHWSDTVDELEELDNGKWSITKEFIVDQTIEYKFNIEGTTWERNRLTRIEHRFPGANQVFIAGSFNNWNPTATPMEKVPGTDIWAVEIGISREDEFKFVIDGEWEGGPNRRELNASPNRILEIGFNSDTIYHNWNDTPAKPVITLDGGEDVIYVMWNSVDSDVCSTGYVLKRAVNEPVDFQEIDYGSQYYHYTDRDVIPGDTYFYKIYAVDSTDSALRSPTSDIMSTQPGILGTAVFYLIAGENPFVDEISIVGDFNNWDKSANILTLQSDTLSFPDSAGVWVGSVDNIIINRIYEFKYLYNRGFNTWENIEGNRKEFVYKTNYHNWGNDPHTPNISAVPRDKYIDIYITTNDIDIKYYDLYRKLSGEDDFDSPVRIFSNTFNTVFKDTNVDIGKEYVYSVAAVDYGNLRSSRSESVKATAGERTTVSFVLDMRAEINRGANPRFGVQIAGFPSPLSSNPIVNNLSEIRRGVYQLDLDFVTNQTVNYYYVYNAGTRREEREQMYYNFEYGPDPLAKQVLAVGDFNGWDTSPARAFKLVKGDDHFWRLTQNLPIGEYNYKYVIDGAYEDGDDRYFNLYRTFVVKEETTRYDVFGELKIQPPQGLVSMAIGSDTIRIDWLPNTEKSVDNYIVYRGNNPKNLYSIATVTATETPPFYLDTDIDSNSEYFYYVKAQSYSYTSDPSITVSAKPSHVPNNVIVNRNNRIIVNSPLDNIIRADIPVRRVEFMDYNELSYQSIYNENYEDLYRKIENANNKILFNNWTNFIDNSKPYDYISVVKFIGDDDKEIHQFDTYITVTLSFDSSLVGNDDLDKLNMYVLNTESQEWEKLDVANENVISVSRGTDTISVIRNRNSVYTLLLSVPSAPDLSGLVVWPNPMYYYSSQSGVITFDNLPNDFEYLRIFTLTGENVYSTSDYDFSGKIEWDCRNNHGHTVAGGLYLYYIKSARSVKTGRFSIIR